MKITLLRHGESIDRNNWNGTDYDRCLTENGREEIKNIGKRISELGWNFDLILTSPYVRALETAKIIAEEIGLSSAVKISEDLACGSDYRTVLKELKSYNSNSKVLIVGHEPNLSSFISFLLSGSSDLNIEMKKAGICRLEIEFIKSDVNAKLIALIPPKIMVSEE